MHHNTITIGDLISELECLASELISGEETPVYVGADYGDICHTIQALRVIDIKEERLAEGRGYSRSGLAVAGEEQENVLSNEKVIVIHGG